MADNLNTREKLAKLKGFFATAVNHPASSSYRTNMVEDTGFYDGDLQLSAKDRHELKDRSQPVIIINMIFSKLNNLMGGQRYTRSRLGVVGRTKFDEGAAHGISDLLRFIADRSHMHDEESECFDDGIISGCGWLECFVEEDEMGSPSIQVRAEEPENMFLDPYSRRYDLKDARFIGRAKWVDFEDAVAMFPGRKKDLEMAIGADTDETFSIAEHGPEDDYDMHSTSGVPYYDKGRRRVRLVEMWYREYAKVMWLRDERGQLNYVKNIEEAKEIFAASLGEEEFDTNLTDKEIKDMLGIIEKKEKVVRTAVFAGDMLFADKLTIYTHRLNINKYPFKPFFCFRKRTKGHRGEPYGFVRQMKDPQRDLNKRRSKAMHILNTTRVTMEEGAVEDKEVLREEVARPDGVVEVKAGKALEVSTDINLAVTQLNIMEQAKKDLEDTSGQFDEAQGKATNARSGRAIAKRTSASNQNTVMVFDNFRRTKNLTGEFLIGLIKQFFTEEHIFTILDDEQATRTVSLNVPQPDGSVQNDVKQALVDIHLEEFPMSPSAQAEQFDELVELGRGNVPIPPDVLIAASSIRNKEELIKRTQEWMAVQAQNANPGSNTPNASATAEMVQ